MREHEGLPHFSHFFISIRLDFAKKKKKESQVMACGTNLPHKEPLLSPASGTISWNITSWRRHVAETCPVFAFVKHAIFGAWVILFFDNLLKTQWKGGKCGIDDALYVFLILNKSKNIRNNKTKIQSFLKGIHFPTYSPVWKNTDPGQIWSYKSLFSSIMAIK